MNNKFQILFSNLIENLKEDVSTTSAFGTPQAGYEISNPTSINPNKGYTDNIMAAMSVTSTKRKKPKMIRRKLQRKTL
jgi:hypothetical protein